jgi:hypothetical protein
MEPQSTYQEDTDTSTARCSRHDDIAARASAETRAASKARTPASPGWRLVAIDDIQVDRQLVGSSVVGSNDLTLLLAKTAP